MAKKNKTISLQWQAFTSTLSTTLVLVMLGLTILTVLTADRLSDDVKSNLSVTLRMADAVSDAEAQQLGQTLKAEPYASDVKFTSKETVLKEQIEAMGSNPEDFLHANPYQSELEVYLAPEYANTDSIANVTELLKANSAVSEVIFQSDLVESLDTNLQRITIVFLVIAGLLLIISMALINSTVRLSVYSRRFLIRTMKLVGASWSFIRRPFMLRSMWIGLIAGLLADAILFVLVQSLYNFDGSLRDYITLQNQAITAGGVVGCGLLITLLCTYISVSHFLKMDEGGMNN